MTVDENAKLVNSSDDFRGFWNLLALQEKHVKEEFVLVSR